MRPPQAPGGLRVRAGKPRPQRASLRQRGHPRDYEAELTAEFEIQGLEVVVWPCGAKEPKPALERLTVVRQFQPRLKDPESGRVLKYQLDFALPELKLNLEFDGFFGRGGAGRRAAAGGHTNWTGFHRDRKRDRLLVLQGWKVLRFGPADLKDGEGVQRAVRTFLQLVEGRADADSQ